MLTVRLAPPQRTLPLFLATAARVDRAGGFHDLEMAELDRFHWMPEQGRLAFEPAAGERYLECWVMSEFHDLSQHVTYESGGMRQVVRLIGGWSPLSLVVPGGAGDATFTVNKVFPREYYPGDERTLSIRMRPPILHQDAARHAHIARQRANQEANLAEMLDGRTRLDSTPPSLGIDMHGACNVKPPCVYCEWDYNKDLEGENVGAPFTRETLADWGPFFDNSVSLVNCSIGEPFMMRNIDDLLDVFGERGKVLEMTTNGQILTDTNIQKLLGRSVDLYISLDAGTPETYAKIRNNTFDRILSNLRRLIEAKGGRGHLPRVHLVFMPMRINVTELDRFVGICADLGVDRMVLRPLNYSESIALDWKREGYRFQYQEELLPFEELVRVSGRAAELCKQAGVELADQMDFGSSMRQLFAAEFDRGRQEVVRLGAAEPEPPPAGPPAGETAAPSPEPAAEAQRVEAQALPSLGRERHPICTEPWKSQYILRRGVLPCCYGGTPIAPMDGYREAWNAPVVQEIRRELLKGRFHAYCLGSPACPIVRKEQEAAGLPAGQTLRLRARSLANHVDRVTGGRLHKVRRPVGWVADRVERALAGAGRLVRGPGRQPGRHQ